MKFECLNKECNKYGEPITYSRIQIKSANGKIIHCDKNGVQHTCNKCNIPLVEIKDEEFKGFGVFHCAFSGKTSAEKIEILKKREREHYKRDKNAHEYKKYKDDGAI